MLQAIRYLLCAHTRNFCGPQRPANESVPRFAPIVVVILSCFLLSLLAMVWLDIMEVKALPNSSPMEVRIAAKLLRTALASVIHAVQITDCTSLSPPPSVSLSLSPPSLSLPLSPLSLSPLSRPLPIGRWAYGSGILPAASPWTEDCVLYITNTLALLSNGASH